MTNVGRVKRFLGQGRHCVHQGKRSNKEEMQSKEKKYILSREFRNDTGYKEHQ